MLGSQHVSIIKMLSKHINFTTGRSDELRSSLLPVVKLICLESISIMETCWDPNTYTASFDSVVRRPDDDRTSRSKHVASHTINNNKNSCA